MQTRQLFLTLLLCAIATGVDCRDFGGAMPEGEPLPLAEAIAQPGQFGEPARKFSGRVTDVCSKKGCWLMLEDNGQAARVVMHEYAFTLPADARGNVVVYGVLGTKDLSAEAAAHLAEDAGRSDYQAGREYRITAYSVRLDDA